MKRAALAALLILPGCEGACAAIKSDSRLAGGAISPEPLKGAASAGFGRPPAACVSPPPGDPEVFYAARCENAYSDGDPVDIMYDWSGNGRNATQATVDNQPIFRDPCETSVIGGNPCYDFDGSNDSLDNTYDDDTEPVTVCFIWQSSETGVSNVVGVPSGGTNILSFAVGAVGGTAILFYGWNAGYVTMNSAAGSYSANSFISGCIRWPGVGTSPEFCVDDSACSGTTAPVGKETFSFGGGVRFGGTQPTTFKQLDLVEWAYYNTDVAHSAWNTYAEDLYGALPQ